MYILSLYWVVVIVIEMRKVIRKLFFVSLLLQPGMVMIFFSLFFF
jgi:hypothetical protein